MSLLKIADEKLPPSQKSSLETHSMKCNVVVSQDGVRWLRNQGKKIMLILTHRKGVGGGVYMLKTAGYTIQTFILFVSQHRVETMHSVFLPPFLPSFIHPSIHSFIHVFIHSSFIHSFIHHSFIQRMNKQMNDYDVKTQTS